MKRELLFLAVLLSTASMAQTLPTDEAYGTGSRRSGTHHAAAKPVDTASEARGNAPPNDDCASAETIVVHPFGSCPISGTIGNNAEATQDGDEPFCDIASGPYLDVWYTFTTEDDGAVSITLAPGAGMGDWVFMLYDGCGGAALYCYPTPAVPQVINLLAFTTYTVRVYSNAQFGTGGEFTLCVETAPPPPANDLCSAAVTHSMAVGDSWTFTGDASTGQNTEAIAYNSVWEVIDLTEPADLTLDFCGNAGSYSSVFYRTLYLTCPPNFVDRVWAGSYDTTACSDGGLSLCYANLPAGLYYVAISPFDNGGPYMLHANAVAPGTHAPANDECEGAIPLSVGTWCNPVNFLPQCPSQSLPAVDCVGSMAAANDDVWYTFIATQPTITIGLIGHSPFFSPTLDVYAGNVCDALTPVACADENAVNTSTALVLNGLTVGAPYTFRAYNGYGTTPLDDASYDLCLVEGDGINIGIEEGLNTSALNIFPNPTTGDFTVRVDPRGTNATISVIDATGRTVLVRNERNTTAGSVLVRADGKLAPGIYTVRCDDGQHITGTRLIIQ